MDSNHSLLYMFILPLKLLYSLMDFPKHTEKRTGLPIVYFKGSQVHVDFFYIIGGCFDSKLQGF